MLKTTLVYIFNDRGETLLQYKARGFGQGKWNGPGGKVESDESVEDCAVREFREETGLGLHELEKRGKLDFVFYDNPDWDNQTSIFIAPHWTGEIVQSTEGELRWFHPDDLPFDEMWEDDRIWLRDVLNGNYVRYRFYFDKTGKLIHFKNLIK